MGNTQVNSTFTPKNYSNITNSSGFGGNIPTTLPPFRPALSRDQLNQQLQIIACVESLTLVINVAMVILTSVRLKAVPYMFIENFMVIDIINAMVTSGPWAVGVLADFAGLGFLPFLCRMQGFFHNTLSTVFLGTVTAIALSRFLYFTSPNSYSMFFLNRPLVRLVLFTIWFGAGLLAAPPLNPGLWGTYAGFEGTCWLSWKEGNLAAVTYSAFHTFVTLGPALTFTSLAIVTIALKRKNTIHPVATMPSTRVGNQPGVPQPAPTTTRSNSSGTHLLNLEVLYISCALFLLYLILWTAITIVEAMFVVHWSMVDYKTVIVLTFLYQSRGLLHPFIYLLLSAQMRRAFAGCSGKGNSGIAGNLPKTSVANIRAPEVSNAN